MMAFGLIVWFNLKYDTPGCQMIRTVKMISGALICLLCFAGTADAACTVSPATIDFGGYSVFSLVPLDATINLNVTCTPRTNVTISIGPSFVSGSTSPRQMSSPSTSDLLNYNLYSDKKRSAIWGEGIDSVSQSSNKPIKIYGRIPNSQMVNAGLYSDSLTVSVLP